jgi:hypothetical protein
MHAEVRVVGQVPKAHDLLKRPHQLKKSHSVKGQGQWHVYGQQHNHEHHTRICQAPPKRAAPCMCRNSTWLKNAVHKYHCAIRQQAHQRCKNETAASDRICYTLNQTPASCMTEAARARSSLGEEQPTSCGAPCT